MKKLTCAAIAVMGVAMASSQASAEELWDPHLRGVDEGLAAGALPPKGLYFVDDNYFATYKLYDNQGKNSSGDKLDAMVNVPILLWNPGFTVLGANYSAAIAQPFDYTSFGKAGAEGDHLGTFNTVVLPVILSWALPHDFFVKPSFAVYLNDASSSFKKGDTPAQGVGAGMANTTYEPAIGFSWLHDGWNVSAQFMYSTSTADNSSILANGGKYQSGDQFSADYTVTKTLGKWTVGVGGYQMNQVERDKANGVDKLGTIAQSYGAGPILGYQFGGVGIQAQYNHAISVHNDVGGDWFNVRFVVPIDLSGITG